ncbi:hypothetical protein V8G54_003421 [Vigna mungo]|uniref:SHSP domain-containing protein n=1 Tax=Vigna mungo TaxID=3915 RepID=A0AAQ3PDE0_VIGMU
MGWETAAVDSQCYQLVILDRPILYQRRSRVGQCVKNLVDHYVELLRIDSIGWVCCLWEPVERSSGKFLRRFRLGENAKMNEVKASMENGALTVTVPKEDVKKPEVKAIEISG